jgi:hypothetical protein
MPTSVSSWSRHDRPRWSSNARPPLSQHPNEAPPNISITAITPSGSQLPRPGADMLLPLSRGIPRREERDRNLDGPLRRAIMQLKGARHYTDVPNTCPLALSGDTDQADLRFSVRASRDVVRGVSSGRTGVARVDQGAAQIQLQDEARSDSNSRISGSGDDEQEEQDDSRDHPPLAVPRRCVPDGLLRRWRRARWALSDVAWCCWGWGLPPPGRVLAALVAEPGVRRVFSPARAAFHGLPARSPRLGGSL